MTTVTETNFYAEWCDASYDGPTDCIASLEVAVENGDIEEVKTCTDWIIADVLDSVRLAMSHGEDFDDAVKTAGEYYGNNYA